jgi:hypothetical protein
VNGARILWLAIGLAAAAIAPAAAESHLCRAPLADWQPPATLRDRLAAEGWADIRIRIDDGCYKVRALGAAGERMERKYDPATLAPLPRGRRGGDAEGDGDGPGGARWRGPHDDGRGGDGRGGGGP